MATKSENADIRELQTKMARVESDIKEVKGDVKSVLKSIENLENIFVTRREVTLIKWVIGVGFAVITAYLAWKGTNNDIPRLQK